MVKCQHEECTKKASFGYLSDNKKVFCVKHSLPEMINLVNFKCKCTTPECKRRARWSLPDSTIGETLPSHELVERRLVPEKCTFHKIDGMINTLDEMCTHPGCEKCATYGWKDNRKKLFCCYHKIEGMINKNVPICQSKGCKKVASCGWESDKTRKFCVEHSEDGMVNFTKNKCEYPGCGKSASFGILQKNSKLRGGNKKVACKQHKTKDMVNLNNPICIFSSSKESPEGQRISDESPEGQRISDESPEGQRISDEKIECGEIAHYGFLSKRKREYCSRHKLSGMINLTTFKRDEFFLQKKFAGASQLRGRVGCSQCE